MATPLCNTIWHMWHDSWTLSMYMSYIDVIYRSSIQCTWIESIGLFWQGETVVRGAWNYSVGLMKYVTQWCLSMSVSQWCHIFHQPYRGVEYRAETCDVSYTYTWHDRNKWCQLQMTFQVMSVTNDMSSDVSYKWHVKWCQLQMTCQVMSVTHDMSSDVSYTWHVKWCQLHI